MNSRVYDQTIAVQLGVMHRFENVKLALEHLGTPTHWNQFNWDKCSQLLMYNFSLELLSCVYTITFSLSPFKQSFLSTLRYCHYYVLYTKSIPFGASKDKINELHFLCLYCYIISERREHGWIINDRKKTYALKQKWQSRQQTLFHRSIR